MPAAVRRALAQERRGLARDDIAADLIRSGMELELFRLQLPVDDRRQGRVMRLAIAVRLRTFD